MSSLTSERHAQLDAIARDTGFESAAVAAMYDRIVAGGGRMAQFDHPAFGGAGQWMQGGMTMIGDMSNDVLRDRVRRLCDALVAVASQAPADVVGALRQGGSQLSGGTSSLEDPQHLAGADGARPPGASGASAGSGPAPATWYPAALGRPDSSGTQNHVRYAWFASARRLAIDDGHGVTIYDTGDHRIGGVSQQQGREQGERSASVAFTSQHGDVDLRALPVVSDGGAEPAAPDVAGRGVKSRTDASPDAEPPARRTPARVPPPASAGAASERGDDPFAALEKLADLHRRGIVDDDEYRAKKSELLARI